MAAREGIFPTFFMSGFECSTFIWKEQGRRDLVEETQHRAHADEDYALLPTLGMAVAREGVPWPIVAKADGGFDFSCVDVFIEAMNKHRVRPIWDLCHYGCPDGVDPFAPDFGDRFAAYARAAAEYVCARVEGPRFFTPINEITFFGFMAGEWGWIAPFRKTRAERHALRLNLAKAAIAGVKAIREIDPDARMVHVDPVINVVAPRDRPDLAEAARRETYEDAFFVWDVIAGLEHPELGGAPEILDVVGANVYSFGQMEYREEGPHASMEPGDDRILPLADMLVGVHERYGRPIIVAETSGLEGGREDWLRDVVHESLAAVNRGVDLHGLCLFPAVDMPDWHTGEWLNNGICDLVKQPDGTLKRVPFQPYVDELRRWQRELNRVTEIDNDPFDQPVDLDDIVAAARRLKPKADADWH